MDLYIAIVAFPVALLAIVLLFLLARVFRFLREVPKQLQLIRELMEKQDA